MILPIFFIVKLAVIHKKCLSFIFIFFNILLYIQLKYFTSYTYYYAITLLKICYIYYDNAFIKLIYI